MIDLIYIEEAVADHPRTEEICRRFPRATRVPCRRYGEIFNRHGQNFRLQKQRPALILARKFDHFVLEAPEGYAIGGRHHFYFSHMLNCIYDCSYCFLQGMFQSAHYLLFVNYEDFQSAIEEKVREAPGEDSYFFSGYDCDSLALDPVTGFADAFLPFFERLNSGWIELRTKSVQIRALLERDPFDSCVVAFSFTPDPISRLLERQVPPLRLRLDAMAELQQRGWKLGLRFDPLIYREDYAEQYRDLFEEVFATIRAESLHSVSLGPFRLPRSIFKNMVRLAPRDRLLAGPLVDTNGMVSYRSDLEAELVGWCTEELTKYIPNEIFFPCEWNTGQSERI